MRLETVIVAYGTEVRLTSSPASVQVAPARMKTVSIVNVGRIGPQGPPGPPGGGGYAHTQSTPAATWVVNHNLGVRPSVSVISPGGIEVEAEIAHISVNQTEIRFTSPQTGTARFI